MGLADCFENVHALVDNGTMDGWSIVCCLLYGASIKEEPERIQKKQIVTGVTIFVLGILVLFFTVVAESL